MRQYAQHMLQRFSFRQLLVIAFLLIAALLGAASLRALFTLEDLTLQSRDNAARALELGSAAQSLGERSISMERTSRQSVVLDDRVLRERFGDEVRESTAILDGLAKEGIPNAKARQWRAHLQTVVSLMSGPPATADARTGAGSTAGTRSRSATSTTPRAWVSGACVSSTTTA